MEELYASTRCLSQRRRVHVYGFDDFDCKVTVGLKDQEKREEGMGGE